MGHSKAEKANTHQRIIAIASKRLREDGLAGVGIADLMKDAGLTVGGFYKHFDSREDLVAQAVGAALGVAKRYSGDSESGNAPITYAKLIDNYLSEAHRDSPGTGCAISALGAEIARKGDRTRTLASEEIRNNLEWIAGLLDGNDRRAARSKAILTFSALVGAIVLARNESDEKLSREILNSVAKLLKKVAVSD